MKENKQSQKPVNDPKTEEEIDLGQLFTLIGKGFTKKQRFEINKI